MPVLPDPTLNSNIKATVVGAIFLLAARLLKQYALDALPSSSVAISKAVGVSKSQAYIMLARLEVACTLLGETPGPATTTVPEGDLFAVMSAVRDYAFDHPGCVAGRGMRRRYSDDFRCFILGLLQPGQPAQGCTIEQLSQAAGIPLGTLKLWLRGDVVGDAEAEPDGAPRENLEDPAASELTSNPAIKTIITEYEGWSGDFTSFCDHLQTNLRLSYGRTFVASVLQTLGLRVPTRRKQLGYAPWSSGTFRRLFPGAQWLGDGTALDIRINGERFAFNLEAIGDVSSNALVGLTVSDAEDQQALLDAFEHALHTTEAQPLSLTLDNKPCNHTDRVCEAVEPTVIIPATPGRGQAKAPLEGSFGLFAQTAPPLLVEGSNPRELARSMLSLVVTLWAWTRNGKPRQRLGGRSPASYYADQKPSAADLAEARAWIDELKSRADKARRTAERRADPIRRQILASALASFGVDDPDERLAISLSRYSMDAILRGVAILGAKVERNTVPIDADIGPYLGGIIRNVDSELELLAMADHLLELRLRHRDLSLAPLELEIATIREQSAPEQYLFALLRRALDAKPDIDFRFFCRHTCEALAKLGDAASGHLTHLVRITSSYFGASKARRSQLIACLTKAVV